MLEKILEAVKDLVRTHNSLSLNWGVDERESLDDRFIRLIENNGEEKDAIVSWTLQHIRNASDRLYDYLHSCIDQRVVVRENDFFLDEIEDVDSGDNQFEASYYFEAS